jgi:hypothetical protein
MERLETATLSIRTATAAAALQGMGTLSFVTPQQAGAFGNVYEFRVYDIALDGATPRMLHVCPYADMNERMRVRGEAVSTGVWPPKGGPDWLTVMQATIRLPAKFSPLC